MDQEKKFPLLFQELSNLKSCETFLGLNLLMGMMLQEYFNNIMLVRTEQSVCFKCLRILWNLIQSRVVNCNLII